jgi:hypothetical protein
LPRASEAGLLGLDAEARHGVDHLRIEAGAVIDDQVTGRRVEWECRADKEMSCPSSARKLSACR